jgi:CBS domain containing-hemolysin-like protein
MLRPDELMERAALSVPDDGPYETVAGYVMSELGRLPVVGDTVRIPTGQLRVERLDGRRIDRLRYTPDPADPAEPAGDTGTVATIQKAPVKHTSAPDGMTR